MHHEEPAAQLLTVIRAKRNPFLGPGPTWRREENLTSHFRKMPHKGNRRNMSWISVCFCTPIKFLLILALANLLPSIQADQVVLLDTTKEATLEWTRYPYGPQAQTPGVSIAVFCCRFLCSHHCLLCFFSVIPRSVAGGEFYELWQGYQLAQLRRL